MLRIGKGKGKEASIERTSSGFSSLPPAYDENVPDEYELQETISETSSASLPTYDNAVQGVASSSSTSTVRPFRATHSYQIDSPGWNLLQGLRGYPALINIGKVDSAGGIALSYQSVQIKKGSGSSVLIEGTQRGDETPLCTSMYRFGFGRMPTISLHDLQGETIDEFQLVKKGLATRSKTMQTKLGKFEWRYGSSSERAAEDANNLLILEKVENGQKTKVAQLVRNTEFRPAGSSRMTSGNGGRLMIDLTEWADAKDEKRQLEVLAMASCLVMLKREMDRRKHMAMNGAMLAAVG